jgi:hypothetical protein
MRTQLHVDRSSSFAIVVLGFGQEVSSLAWQWPEGYVEPQLYLWGHRIDVLHGECSPYEPLLRVREALEPDIRRFVTEPDIMLVAAGEMVVSIEAKFGFGNPLAHGSADKAGEKPTSRTGLLAHYLGARTSDVTKHIVRPEHTGANLHSQLFRNIIFAAEMAGDTSRGMS